MLEILFVVYFDGFHGDSLHLKTSTELIYWIHQIFTLKLFFFCPKIDHFWADSFLCAVLPNTLLWLENVFFLFTQVFVLQTFFSDKQKPIQRRLYLWKFGLALILLNGLAFDGLFDTLSLFIQNSFWCFID